MVEIPFGMRVKTLCSKCIHFNDCSITDRSKVLESIYDRERCDGVCGECSLCCSQFESRFDRPSSAKSETADDNELPF